MENLQNQIQQARSLERAQKNDAALEVFLRLTGEDGPHLEDPSFWLHTGDLARRTGKAEVAREAYPRAIELLERGGQPNTALAVARRWTRADAESAPAHLRLGTLASTLGYGREARTGLLQALDLSMDEEILDPAVEALRATWGVLRRGGFNEEAESVRARLLEIRPSADPLDDPSLAHAAAPDHLDILDPTGERADPTSEPGLQPTSVGDIAEPEVDRLEGLEPTSAGGWSTDPEEDDAYDSDGDVPGHPDLPLLRTGPEEEPTEEEAAEPLPGLMPTAEAAPELDGVDDDDELAAGELPLLSAIPDLPDAAEEEPAEAVDADAGSGADFTDESESVDWTDPADDDLAEEPTDGSDPGAATLDEPDSAEDEPDADLDLPRSTEPTGPLEARAEDEAARELPAPVLDEPPPAASPPSAAAGPASEGGGDYIDLGELIRSDDDVEDGTRFQMDAAQHPSGDEDRDFAEILGKFRQQVSEKIHPQDSSSHYDLGLAFKDMGLLDDAIAQLQVALRGGSNPVATLEVLGECFIEKGEHSLAARVLERATQVDRASDSDLVGVLYWLGRTSEVLGNQEGARGYYERVVAVDISFRDAGARLDSLRAANPPETAT